MKRNSRIRKTSRINCSELERELRKCRPKTLFDLYSVSAGKGFEVSYKHKRYRSRKDMKEKKEGRAYQPQAIMKIYNWMLVS